MVAVATSAAGANSFRLRVPHLTPGQYAAAVSPRAGAQHAGATVGFRITR
jgi:hypothetical protein